MIPENLQAVHPIALGTEAAHDILTSPLGRPVHAVRERSWSPITRFP
jgi:hypothetical protein